MESSSADQGPLLTLALSQHGALPIFTEIIHSSLSLTNFEAIHIYKKMCYLILWLLFKDDFIRIFQ